MPPYKFGTTSQQRLKDVCPELQHICHEMLQFMDITILCGHRDEEAQTQVFNDGLSKLEWPNSLHNSLPSSAVDIAPYDASAHGGVDWNDKARFGYMAGLFKALAHKKGYVIRWGGDWDGDGAVKDHSFQDMPHFEFHGYQ